MGLINIGAGLSALGESVANTAGRMGLEEQRSQLETQKLQLAETMKRADQDREFAHQDKTNAAEIASRERIANSDANDIQSVVTGDNDEYVGITKTGGKKPLGIKSTKPTDPVGGQFQGDDGEWYYRTESGKTIDTGKKGKLPENQADKPIVVKPGDKVIDHTGKTIYGGDSPNAPGAGDIHGDDFLKTLENKDANLVKSLADGRMAFPTGAALRSEYWQQKIDQVSQYDPDFDAVNYNSRSKTRTDFTSGNNAKNIRSLNTAIGHLGTLASQIGGTNSSFLPMYNRAANFAQRETGGAGATNFEQTASALATELTAVFRGTGGAEADVKRYLEQLDVNASETQKKAAVKNITDLLRSRLEAIGDSYQKGMGKSSDPLELLDQKAATTLKKLAGEDAPAQKNDDKPQLALPDAARSKLREGIVTTFGNNQKWTLRGGQPVQVQ